MGTSPLHIDDDGCLCETCGIVQELCDTWKYVVMMQEETHDRASLHTKGPEITLKMNIAKCAGYHKKEETHEEE